MKRGWVLPFGMVVLFSGQARSAFEPFPVEPRSAGMGGAVFFSVPLGRFQNPAFSDDRGTMACAFSSSRPYGLSGLGSHAIGGSYTRPPWGVSLHWHAFGTSIYAENTLAWGISRRMESGSLGFLIRCLHLTIAGYGQTTAWTIDAGIRYPITPGIWIGGSFSNLPRSRIGKPGHPLPQRLMGSVAFTPSTFLTAALAFEKDIRYPTQLRAGLEFHPHAFLFFRCGLTQSPSTASLGVGLDFSFFVIDYAVLIHPVLGQTHLYGILFRRPGGGAR